MRALVLSGGGCKGAYQVGALEFLINHCNYSYDMLFGVSVGALNVGFLSMFGKGEDKNAIRSLREVWNNINTSKIHKRWFPFGELHSLWKQSMYNSTPLHKLVRHGLDLDKIRKSGKTVGVGAVCLETGEYRVFNQTEDCFIDGILASSAFPVMYRPIKIEGKTWVDGGVKEITPLQAAINCGAKEIDVIICAPPNNTATFNSKANALKVAERTISLMSDEILSNDIINVCNLHNENLNIRIIRPNKDLANATLDFDQQEIQRMIVMGYNDAKYIITTK